jgi:phospholipid-binding lipoprotein MlaA
VARWLLLIAVLAVGGCASPHPAEQNEGFGEIAIPYDPFESLNRELFETTMDLDKAVLRPVARGYQEHVPVFARARIRNLLETMSTPSILINDLLQGEVSRARVSLGRLLVNATLGLGGLFDVAGEWGLEFHNEDLGQTLAVWGVPSGPYFVLPLVGPTTTRDNWAWFVNLFLDPLHAWAVVAGPWVIVPSHIAAQRIDEREKLLFVLDTLEDNSLDLYTVVRSLYFQNRNFKIRNQEPARQHP